MADGADLSREVEAALALKQGIEAAFADDPELVLDTIEGETQLFELLDALLLADLHDAELMDGLASAVKVLQERKERFDHRIKVRRALIERALAMLEIKKLVRPTATLSLSVRKPKVEITDESLVPSQFFKSEPTLQKKVLNDFVAELLAKQDAEIEAAKAEGRQPEMYSMPEGTTLSNGGMSLTVRRK